MYLAAAEDQHLVLMRGVAFNSPESDDDADAKFCSTATLIFGPDQTYDYIDCARQPGKATYFVSPTIASSASSTSTSESRPTLLPSSVPPSGAGTTNPTNTTTGSGSEKNDAVTSTNEKEDAGSSRNTGVIVGGTLGGLTLIVGSAIAVAYLFRHNRASQKSNSHRERGSRDIPDVSTSLSNGGILGGYPFGEQKPGLVLGAQEEAQGGIAELHHDNSGLIMPPVELPAEPNR